MTGYKPRELVARVREALEALPVVVITGLRQVGKTTFLEQDPLFRGRRYLSLDDFAVLEAARRDPEALLAGTEPLTIDEAQRCPELLIAIKRTVDRACIPGRILLSGSANFALLRSVGETLAGRAIHLTLHPFTRREREGTIRTRPFLARLLEDARLPRSAPVPPLDDEEILAGGLPPVALRDTKHPRLWFRGYEQTYLERDVRELSQVGDLVAFRTFLHLAAARTAQVLNLSALARDAKLTSATAARYLGLLETSYVMARLPPFLRNRTSRLVKSPKLFVSDSGLACHLTGVTELHSTADEPLRGALFETFVGQSLAAIAGAHLPEVEITFWHVQGRHEVDFVVSTRRGPIAIEVKAGARFTEADLSGLRAFKASTPRARAGVLAYNGNEAVSLGGELFAIPIGLLLS